MAESIDTVLVRAAELISQGQSRAAVRLLRPAVAEHPEHAGAWCRLGEALLDAGQPAESLDAAKRAITLGERSWAHRLASLALVELGRHEEAVSSAAEAVRREPADWRGHVALAEALAAIAPEEAVGAARRAVEAAPREPRTHEVLGDAAVLAHDLALAKRSYRDVLRLDPGNGRVRAEFQRLASVRSADPDTRTVSPAPRLGRVPRIALWLVLRRSSVWLVAGTFVLIIAGLPRPSQLLAWFGLALLLAVLGTAGHAVLGLPEGARMPPRLLARAEPLAAAAAGLLALGSLLLAIWVVALALGAGGMQLLTVTLICSALAGGIGLFGLWRAQSRRDR